MYAKKLLNRTPARAVLVVFAVVLLSFAFLREPVAVLLTFLLAVIVVCPNPLLARLLEARRTPIASRSLETSHAAEVASVARSKAQALAAYEHGRLGPCHYDAARRERFGVEYDG